MITLHVTRAEALLLSGIVAAHEIDAMRLARELRAGGHQPGTLPSLEEDIRHAASLGLRITTALNSEEATS
mgnify:FL=1